jgi:hypothetical protein
VIEPGARVWAVRNADQDTVWAFGFGTYIGDFPRPGGVSSDERAVAVDVIRSADRKPSPIFGWIRRAFDEGLTTAEERDREFAEAEQCVAAERARPMSERVDELVHQLSLNPKIVLDDGGVVWGCECWWNEADDATPEAWAKGRRIEIVPAPHPAEDSGHAATETGEGDGDA